MLKIRVGHLKLRNLLILNNVNNIGIDKKKKKDRLVWDDMVSEWVTQFSYKKAQAEADKNWMIPLKQIADPTEDPYEKLAEAKREKVAKNETSDIKNSREDKERDHHKRGSGAGH